MEIEIKKDSIRYKLPNSIISGILTDNFNISYKDIYKVNGERVTNKNRIDLTKDIIFVDKNIETDLITVEEYMTYYIEVNNLSIKNPEKKIKDSLKIVGLKDKVLKKNIKELSSAEKSLIKVSVALLNNPKELILDEIFTSLDIKLEKKIYRLLMELNDKYNIGIILLTRDVEKLYKYTGYIVIIKDGKIVSSGNTKEVFVDVDLLKENNIELPDIVEFTYKARKVGAKIDYHRDIRDIIKDIYKHI